MKQHTQKCIEEKILDSLKGLYIIPIEKAVDIKDG